MFVDTMHVNFVQLVDVVPMQTQTGQTIVLVVGPAVLLQVVQQVEATFI
jgi:hypothetical protein